MDFEALAVMVPMEKPFAVMLSVLIGVGLAWLCSNSLRVVRRDVQPLYSAESSTLDVDDITCLMMAESVGTALLLKFLLF